MRTAAVIPPTAGSVRRGARARRTPGAGSDSGSGTGAGTGAVTGAGSGAGSGSKIVVGVSSCVSGGASAGADFLRRRRPNPSEGSSSDGPPFP
ncbi:hypothetical protein GCM10027600_05510 [Nocardioides ginsengisegetis]